MTPSRRVLVCAGHFHPHHGGVERYTRELWRRLAARGWEVTVLTGDTGGGARREVLDGLRVIRLPVAHPVYEELPIPLPVPFLAAALEELVAWAPGVVVTNTRFFPTTLLGILVARRAGAGHLHIEHGSSHVPLGNPVGDALSRLIDRTLGRWAVRRADRCVGVSAAAAAFLVRLGAAEAGTLPNGIDPAVFAVEAGPWRARLAIGPEASIILYVGRLVEEKRVDDLVEAFRRLDDAASHLVIAGEGRHRAALAARTSGLPRVHLLGSVPAGEVPGLLRAATVFCHPSAAAEGLPTVVLEAAAAGLPIVATSAGGTTEVLGSPELGVLVPRRDPAALAGALRSLLGDPNRRTRMGEAVRRHVAQRFAWDHVADLAEAELRQLLACGRGTQ